MLAHGKHRVAAILGWVLRVDIGEFWRVEQKPVDASGQKAVGKLGERVGYLFDVPATGQISDGNEKG